MERFTVFFGTVYKKQKYDTRLFLVSTCLSKKLLHGTEVGRGPYSVGEQARYVCNPGYILVGSSVLNCLEKNSEAGWSEDLPICLTHLQFKKFCSRLAEEIVLRDGKYGCGKISLLFLFLT